jgi:hypothetical protein
LENAPSENPSGSEGHKIAIQKFSLDTNPHESQRYSQLHIFRRIRKYPKMIPTE